MQWGALQTRRGAAESERGEGYLVDKSELGVVAEYTSTHSPFQALSTAARRRQRTTRRGARSGQRETGDLRLATLSLRYISLSACTSFLFYSSSE